MQHLLLRDILENSSYLLIIICDITYHQEKLDQVASGHSHGHNHGHNHNHNSDPDHGLPVLHDLI